MSTAVSLLNGIAVTLFGSILSASFCGALSPARNRRIFCWYMMLVLLIQGVLSIVVDAELLRQLYPLTIHLPLVLVLCFLTGKLIWPVFSVFTAYLCCQLRRWLALLVVALVSGGETMQDAVELVLTVPLLLFLLRFVSTAVRLLSGHSVKIQCQFAVIPALYYVFDYGTMVYTDLLMSSGPVVVEFMPFVCCGAYLAFLLYNSVKDEKSSRLQQNQKTLDLQLKQSVREIGALRESQELARRYRHDIRHHLQYVSACIENGQGEQAQAYISGICKEIDAQKVAQYCENETVNLILSAFAGRADKEGVDLKVQGELPAVVAVPDSDLCVLLSNALENAIHACRTITDPEKSRVIDVQFFMREEKLFLQVTNPCGEEVRFENGLPVSDRPNHGIGVQSICAIVDRYHGIYTFSARDGIFTLRISV